MHKIFKLPPGDSEVVLSTEGESLPGDSSPKSDTTLKRSLSLCQDENENEKMPTYSGGDDDVITPLEEPTHYVPTPAIPVSASFDSSESEAFDSPTHKVKIVEQDAEGVAITKDGKAQKIGQVYKQKFQHYTRVPQLRKDVSNKNDTCGYCILRSYL